ncbi:hypothetical protein FRC10_001187 [Ceratobasidium sp. 414]|nr:hypothetical protein FRC10_001187 [Ceratobasidium sp. 414]
MAHVQSKPISEPGPSTRKGKRKTRASTPDAATTANATPATKKHGGRTRGLKNLTIENKAAFVDLIEELKPIGNAGWECIFAAYNKKYPDVLRKPKTLRKLWDDLTSGRPPTGNSPMDILVHRALDIAAAIEVATATKSLDDDNVPPPTSARVL